MYSVDVKKSVFKFINELQNSKEIIDKLKLLEKFKGKERIRLDIERLQG